MKDVLIPRIESLLQETRRTRRAAVAGVILASIVALLAWGQVAGWGPPAVFAQNTEAMGTVTLASDGRVEIHNTLTATVSGVTDPEGVTNAVYTYKWFYARPGETCDVAFRRINHRGIDGNKIIINYTAARKSLCVRVEFEDDALNAEVLNSDATTAVPSGAVIDIGFVDEFGDLQFDVALVADVGKTLSVKTDFVDYPDLATTPAFTYQWIYWDPVDLGLDGDEGDIPGATGQTYVIQESDAGKYISVELTFACDVAHVSCSSTPRTTFANFTSGFIQVPPPSLALTSGAISGEPEVHSELTAAVTAVGVTSPTYAFEWYAVPPGQTFSETAHLISGASGATYTPVNEDIGKEIVAIVRFRNDQSVRQSARSTTAFPVRSSGAIDAPRGYYIDAPLQVNTAVMNLRGLPAASTFTYQWIYVSANGTSEGPAAGAPSDTQSYALTSADDGRYLQVEITFTETIGSTSRTVLANMQTPAIGERPPAEYAEDLSAQVPTNGGSVRLTWSLASTGSDLPAKFQYRYKPTICWIPRRSQTPIGKTCPAV